MKKLTNIGDTIVEVLIALAVLAAVLGGAYASAGKSVQATREAQERGEALKFNEEQLERLKALHDANPALTTNIFDYCISDTLGVTNATPPAACKTGVGVQYKTSIHYTPPSAGIPELYTATSLWDSISGSGQNNVTITYRP